MNAASPGAAGAASDLRVLVTGSSGFVGSHIAERYARAGATVAGLARTLGRLEPLARSGACAFLQCDLSDAAATTHIVRKFAPTLVFHFASRPDAAESVEHARASVDANITATVNLLDAATPTVRALVYGDSCKVFGANTPPYRESTPVDPNSSYSATKAAAWWICRAAADARGFAAVSVRPTLIYGPGQGMNVIEYVASRALAGAPSIELDGGRQTRDPLYIDDAVEACALMAERAHKLHGRAIPVGGGSEISVETLANRVVAACKASASIITRPERARTTEIWESWCDNADAHTHLGWAPRVTLQDGLTRTVEDIRARRDANPDRT